MLSIKNISCWVIRQMATVADTTAAAGHCRGDRERPISSHSSAWEMQNQDSLLPLATLGNRAVSLDPSSLYLISPTIFFSSFFFFFLYLPLLLWGLSQVVKQ